VKSSQLDIDKRLETNDHRKRMIAREIFAKSALSKSQVYDYALNPYVGCSHACKYCYAAFMRRFTGHKEKWGEFVDIKINAQELPDGKIKKKRISIVVLYQRCLRSVSGGIINGQ